MNDLFWWFLGVTPPAQAVPSSWSVGVSWLGLALWVAGALLGLILAMALYRRETVPIAAPLGSFLVSLRALAVASLAWLAFSPLDCSVRLEGSRPRPIALILDRSQSMNARDERHRPEEKQRLARLSFAGTGVPSRLEVGQALLQDRNLDLLAKLAKVGPISWYGAGERTVSLGGVWSTNQPLPEWSATEARSALGRAIEDLARAEDTPAAMILVTDGRQTPGLDPGLSQACRFAKERGVPVHFLGLGAAEPPRLEIRDLDAPEILQAGERILVRLRWRASGLDPGDASGRIEITMEMDGAEVAREELPAREGDDQRTVLAFRVPPGASARAVSTLSARARLVLGSMPTVPSRLDRQVRVTNRPVRILLVEQVPRWDYRFLMMQLAREGPAPSGNSPAPAGVSVQPSFVILKGDADLASREPFLPRFPSRTELFSFDAVLLGDVSPQSLGEDGAETLRRFVEEGGGLVLQSGASANPSSWAGTPLAELLPIEPDRLTAPVGANPNQTFLPLPTPEGLGTDAFRLADTPEETAAAFARFPPMYRFTPVARLKPGARSLLSHPTLRCASGPVPLMATQSYGRGRVAWLGIEETWRWRYNAGEKFFARFWTQWLLWAAASRSDAPRRVRLSMDRRDPPAGSSGEIRARLLDTRFSPDTRDKVTARILMSEDKSDASPESGRDVELKAVPGQPGEYSLPLVHDRPGKYQLRIPGDDGPGLEWTVFAPIDAEATGGLAEAAMKAATLDGAGGFFGEADVGKLAESLVPRERPWSVEAPLPRWHPAWFGLVVIFLGVEWWLRRRNQLS